MKVSKNILRFGKIVLAAVLLTALPVALLCTCSGPAVWGDLGRPSDPVPFMEKVRTGTLPGGLRYFILENSKPENRAYLTLAVKAGSVLEEEDERGLAHFVEHMAFNGTERFPKSELVDYLRSLGMRFGPEVNAYTTFDSTVYGIEVPVETSEDGGRRIPDRAMAVIDDWSRTVSFDPEAMDNERLVVMEEYRSRLGAWDRIRRQWLPVLFRGSPYAERLPIGLPEIIENAPASRLEGFYKKWYRADNMALILVGDFDGAALEASLQDHFSIEQPATPLQLPVYDLPLPKKGNIETLILTDPELTSVDVNLYFRRNREPMREDLAYYRNEIIDILIDRMLSLRFEDAAEKPETPYTGAGAGTASYGYSSRFYVLMADAKTGSAEATLAELLRTKESMLRYGFTDTELAVAADSLVSDFRQQVQEKDHHESNNFINYLTRYYLRGGNLSDVEWELDALQQLLPGIRAKDVNAVIRNYFGSDDLQVFIFAPDAEQESLPSDTRIRQMVAESRRMKIERPRSDAVGDRLLSSEPRRGEVISGSVDNETGAVIWELGNGAKVILKATENKNDEIVLQAMARGGTSSVSDEDAVSAGLAVEMMQVSGLGPLSRSELSRILAPKQVSFSQWLNQYNRGFTGSTSVGDLKTLFEMLYLTFTDPRIDSEPVNAMMSQYETSLAHRSDNPRTVFFDEVRNTIYGNNPRFKALELDDLPKADTAAALAFIRKSLNPADYTFVFTGNLTDSMRDYVETYIGSIPPGVRWNEWRDLNITRPGKVERNVYKGREEQSRVYLAWFVPAPFSEELNAASQVLNGYLDIRLIEEIREKLGGVYSIGVNVSASFMPRGELGMAVSFACDPGRVGELSTAVISLLNQTAGISGINQDTFTKAVEALKKEWETSIQGNSYIALSYANSSVLLNAPLSRLDRRPQYYTAVTPADVRRVCAQLLQGNNGPARVVLLPER